VTAIRSAPASLRISKTTFIGGDEGQHGLSRHSAKEVAVQILTFDLLYLHKPKAPTIAANRACHQNKRGRVAFIDRK